MRQRRTAGLQSRIARGCGAWTVPRFIRTLTLVPQHGCRGPDWAAQPHVFLPEGVDGGKAAKLQRLGARVTMHGSDCLHSEAAARQQAQASGGTYLSPYNDEQVQAR